jgi:hypothetical protein
MRVTRASSAAFNTQGRSEGAVPSALLADHLPADMLPKIVEARKRPAEQRSAVVAPDAVEVAAEQRSAVVAPDAVEVHDAAIVTGTAGFTPKSAVATAAPTTAEANSAPASEGVTAALMKVVKAKAAKTEAIAAVAAAALAEAQKQKALSAEATAAGRADFFAAAKPPPAAPRFRCGDFGWHLDTLHRDHSGGAWRGGPTPCQVQPRFYVIIT